MADLSLGNDLRAFSDASPSPAHAVADIVRRLRAGGFTALDEAARWVLAPGDQRCVVRGGGSIVAFRVGSAAPSEAGFRIVGAHTDSPTFKVRPRHDVRQAGYRLVGVEPYGGLLAHTWLDRELTVAGRVMLRGGEVHLVVLLVRRCASRRWPSTSTAASARGSPWIPSFTWCRSGVRSWAPSQACWRRWLTPPG